jgi:CRP/FNR family cyclic AMP-dependent transcriptional regulator
MHCVTIGSASLIKSSWPLQSLLGRLDGSARDAIFAIGVRKRVQPGQQLLREGATESFVVLLEDALTKVTVALADGRQALMAIRMSGDLVGEIAALNGTPRSATVTACRASVVRVITSSELRTYLRSQPEAAMTIAGIVADKLRWSNLRRIDFTSFPVKVRLARALADIAATYGVRSSTGVVVDIHLTQAELATLCGAAEVSLQKAMSELRRAGIVDTRYRGFIVRDEDALRVAARLHGDSR